MAAVTDDIVLQAFDASKVLGHGIALNDLVSFLETAPDLEASNDLDSLQEAVAVAGGRQAGGRACSECMPRGPPRGGRPPAHAFAARFFKV